MAHRDPNEILLEILKCNSCDNEKLRLEPSGEALSCPKCGERASYSRGIVDFMGETGPATTFAQRMMEFKPLVRAYERLWRPLITVTVTNYRWERGRVKEFMDLEPGMTVMDIACGTGEAARKFAREVSPDGYVIGVDLSRPMLECAADYIARESVPNAALVRSDILTCPLADGSFDRVHCSGALHLFPELQEVFNRIYKWLKPGGAFIGSTYLLGKGKYRRSRKRESGERVGMHWFEPEELEEHAKTAGFINYEPSIHREGIVFCAVKPAGP